MDVDERQYEVEKILDRRIIKAISVEYMVKWEGYDSSVNSWVKAKDMNCGSLIDVFEKTTKFKLKYIDPFSRGYEAKEILNVGKLDDVLMFEILFHDKQESEHVSSNLANIYCPELVINFYENKIDWQIMDSDDDDNFKLPIH